MLSLALCFYLVVSAADLSALVHVRNFVWNHNVLRYYPFLQNVTIGVIARNKTITVNVIAGMRKCTITGSI